MKKPVVVILTVILALAEVVTAGVGVVQAGICNEIPDTGKHYTLNIIGVPHGKTADMKDSHRHTLSSIGHVSAHYTIRYTLTE